MEGSVWRSVAQAPRVSHTVVADLVQPTGTLCCCSLALLRSDISCFLCVCVCVCVCTYVQGKLEMWVEILTLDQARTITPVPISPPQPEEWELRVVVWETNDCTLKAGVRIRFVLLVRGVQEG